MPYEDLIKEFGSGAKDSKSDAVETPYHDLIKEFGSGGVEAVPPPIQKSAPSVVRPPISGVTSEESARINALPVNVGAPRSTDRFVNSMINAPAAIAESVSNLPTEYSKDVQSAKATLSKGIDDVTANKSATGVGEIGLGALQTVGAYIGANTLVRKTQELVKNVSGDPAFADKASLLATSGLPIKPFARAAIGATPVNRAFNTIVESIGPDNLDKTIKVLKSNPRLTLTDVVPQLQIINQGLAAKPGKSRDFLNSAVSERTGSAKGAVTEAYNDVMGAPVNVLDKIDTMKAKARATGANEINPVVENSGAADITDVIKHIDKSIASGGMVERRTLEALKKGETPSLQLSEAQSHLFDIRERLRGDWKDRDQMFLDVKGEQGAHNIQRDLRRKAQDLLDSPEPSNRSLGIKLMDVRNKIVDAIDTQSGGKYREGLSKYADDMDIQDAFTKGTNVFRNRPTVLEDRPEYLERWLRAAKPDEVQTLKEGARVAIDNQIRGFKSAARKGTDVPEIEFNAKKMELLYGKEEAAKLFEKLQHERMIADTNHKLFANSQTAMRELGAKATEVRPDYQPNFTKTILPIALESGAQWATGGSVPILGAAAGLAYPYARGKLTQIGQKLDHRTNLNIAELSMATGEARDNLIKALEAISAQSGKSKLQKIQNFALPVLPP